MSGPDDRNGDYDNDGFANDDAVTDGYDTADRTPEELALTDEDEPLPWLESADYDTDSSADTGRIVGLLLMGLLVVGALVAAIWLFTRPSGDPDLVADGSLITAPEGDYKTRPDDAGGTEVEGTGDNSFAVGEGETREGRLANGETVRPSIAARSTDEATPDTGDKPAAAANAGTAGATGGVGVQVGAYSTKETATAGWGKLTRQTDALDGVKYRVVQGEADIGTVFRLQAVASDNAAADKLCAALKADGVACQVKR